MIQFMKKIAEGENAMKYIIKRKVLFFFVLALLLGGCSPTSKKSLVSYAKGLYGQASLVSSSETDQSTEIVLKDKEYDFTYTVKSNVSEINIDGSDFGDSESKSDDFMKRYLECFYDKSDIAALENKYEVKVTEPDLGYLSNYNTNLGSISGEKSDAAAAELREMLVQYDYRGIFKNKEGYFVLEGYGEYDYDTDEALSDDEVSRKWADDFVHNTMSAMVREGYYKEGDYEHAVFLRSEKTTWGDYSDNGYARQNGDYSIYKDGMLYDSFNGIPDDIEFTMYYYKLPDGTMFYICTGLSENGSMPATDRHE